MREKLIQYIDRLFADAESTPRLREMHDELLQNCLDRYDEELGNGKSEQEAYDRAIDAIGDMNGLLESCSGKRNNLLAVAIGLYVCCMIPVILCSTLGGIMESIGVCLMFAMAAAATALLLLSKRSPSPEAVHRKKLRAFGIALYILCPTPVIFFGDAIGGHAGGTLGICLMFLCIGAATVLMVSSGRTKPAAPKNDRPADAENAYSSANASAEGGPRPQATAKAEPVGRSRGLAWQIGTPIYWVFAACLFAVLCAGGGWYYAWLIFPVFAALGDVITGLVLTAKGLGGTRKLVKGLLWLAALAAYCMLTKITGMWAITWLIFPINCAVSGVINGIFELNKEGTK